MKTQFLLALLLPLLAGPLESEQLLDVLTLTDGSRFTGILTEYSPSETLSLQALDGRQLTFPIEQIAAVGQQPSPTPIAVRYIEVVFLKDGVIFRGSIVEQAPGSWILLRTANGLELRFGIEEIWKIVRARMLEGVAEEEGERQVEELKGRLQLSLPGASAAVREPRAEEKEEVGVLKDEINSLLEELAQAEGEKPGPGIEEQHKLLSTDDILSRLQSHVETLGNFAVLKSRQDIETVAAQKERLDAMAGKMAGLVRETDAEQKKQAEIQKTRAELQRLIQSRAWRKKSNRTRIQQLASSLPRTERLYLYAVNELHDQGTAFGLNLLPFCLGSWLQRDHLFAALATAAFLTGVGLYVFEALPAIAIDPVYGLSLDLYPPMPLGYIGIGLAATAYAGMLLRPFLYVYQWNRELAILLDVSDTFLEWKKPVLYYKMKQELRGLGSRASGIGLNLLTLRY